MIPMLFPHASSVFSHGSPNLSLTTLQYCHFDHAKRPQQHEPSVLPSHSPPTSPGRHWGSRHLRIVSAGSWINKDQVAKLQRKKNKFSRSCYSPVLLNQNIDSQTSWWWCQLRPQSSAPPVFFFWGGGKPSQIHMLLTCHRGPCLGTSFFFHIQTQPWNVGELDQLPVPWVHDLTQWCWKIFTAWKKTYKSPVIFVKRKWCERQNFAGNYVFHPLIFRGVHSPDLSWKLNMMIYP